MPFAEWLIFNFGIINWFTKGFLVMWRLWLLNREVSSIIFVWILISEDILQLVIWVVINASFRKSHSNRQSWKLKKLYRNSGHSFGTIIMNMAEIIWSMGEAKRRKEKGLAPKTPKEVSKSKSPGLLIKYPRLPLYVGLLFGLYLIFDWIKLNSAG